MMNLIHSFERGAFAIGMAAVNSGNRPATRTRIIRETSRGTIDRLVEALRTARSERDAARRSLAALHAENAKLRLDLDAHRYVLDRISVR